MTRLTAHLRTGEGRPVARPFGRPVTTMTTSRSAASFRQDCPHKGGDYPAPGGMLLGTPHPWSQPFRLQSLPDLTGIPSTPSQRLAHQGSAS